jgi:hypothetical protein
MRGSRGPSVETSSVVSAASRDPGVYSGTVLRADYSVDGRSVWLSGCANVTEPLNFPARRLSDACRSSLSKLVLQSKVFPIRFLGGQLTHGMRESGCPEAEDIGNPKGVFLRSFGAVALERLFLP